MIQKKPLLISIAAFIASYLLVEFVPSYDFWGYAWFPYLHYFNAAVILSWNVVLYFFIARLMTFKRCVLCAASVAACTVPYSIFLVFTYPAWGVFGVSVILTAFLCVWAKKLHSKGVKR